MRKDNKMKDYYLILGVSPNVSQEVLAAIYKNLVKNQVDNIEEIEEAYKILSNATLREEYDNKLKNNTDNHQHDNMKQEVNETIRGPIKRKPKYLLSIIIIAIVILGIKLLCSESPSANTLWGTFETENGNILSVEMLEDYGDDLYTAYITRTEVPWVKEYVVIDLETCEISYFLTEEKVLFEFKNRKLTFNSDGKEYKKISDDSNYKSVLDKGKMIESDIIGTYKNVDGIANIIISKSNEDGMVNVWVGDFIGNTLGYTENIPYKDFFDNRDVNISIDGKSFPMHFAHSKVIICNAFQLYNGGFIKQSDINVSNTENLEPDKDTYKNTTSNNNTASSEIDYEIIEDNESLSDEKFESTIGNNDDSLNDSSSQNSEIMNENPNEKYEWYINNSMFANQDHSVRIEVYKEDDEHFTMSWGDIDWDNEVEHNWQFSLDIIPDEIGANEAFIYKGNDGRIIYYPDENAIIVEMGDINYDGIYKPF